MATKQHRESDEIASFLKRMARALVKRAAAGDLDALSALRSARAFMDEAEVEAGRLLHEQGNYPWPTIAEHIGVTKQAAAKRYGG